jgi:Domain of unknown function (DUF4412)
MSMIKKTIIACLLISLFASVPSFATGFYGRATASFFWFPVNLTVHGDNNKLRVDTSVFFGLFKMGTDIYRYDKKVKWSLKEDEKTYTASSISSNPDSRMIQLKKVSRKDLGRSIGREIIAGYLCDRYRTENEAPDPTDPTWVAYSWVNKDDYALKGIIKLRSPAEDSEGKKKKREEVTLFSWEVKEIKFAPQNPKLFEIPKGYTRER